MKGARAVMFFMMAACLAACGTSSTGPTETVPLGQPFTLGVGEAAVVDTTGLRIEVVKVANDSRCPVDVQCITEGDATVTVAVVERSSPQDYELHTSGRFPREATHEAYRVTLVRLDPAPRSTVRLSPSDYRATLVVAR